MITLRPGSHVYRLLLLLAIAGEYPMRSLHLLGSSRTLEDLVHRLGHVQDFRTSTGADLGSCKMITTSGRGERRTIRLYKSALPLLQTLHPAALAHYLDITRNHRFSGSAEHIERNHRVAETVAMCLVADVETRPFLLPVLQRRAIQQVVLDGASFYTAKSVKRLDHAEMNKTIFTRLTGALFSPGYCYAVYNTRNAVMKWSGMGEFKTARHLEELSRMNAGPARADHALLLGENMDLALQTLLESDKSGRIELRFDRIYPHVHFIPMTEQGIRLLRLLTLPDWKERVLSVVFPEQMRTVGPGVMEYDAQNGNTLILSHLDGDIARLVRVRQALEDSRANNLAVEKLFTPYIWGQEMVLHLFSVLILAASVGLCLTGTMTLANALMAVIVSFLIFSQIQSAGSGVSALRLVGSSIDHANQVDDIPEMDQRGTAIRPESHEIVFDHVNFSYGSRPILKDVSLTIPDRTTTAIVAPSGSGKTTLCNLIARFWDVDGGRVTIGGRDVREYTLESLMEQVSMVFQRVYLFADTVENNIKFGCPGATHEQVVEAAKKACCHDFISALPDGYNTVIGEGGATLSGGEKQRISIARCLLKDAPIVIFDEATANVDPENEDQLQRAMEALTREKTVLMIAHRLKTVRGADQILVLDQGRIVQKGTHDELIQQAGIYRNFVSERTKSSRWIL